MALRLDDESLLPEPSGFEAADTKLVALPPGSCVGADQRPVVFHTVESNKEVPQKHLQIWKAGHESLRHLGDGLTPNSGSAAIHAERAVRRVKGSHACRRFDCTTPRYSVLRNRGVWRDQASSVLLQIVIGAGVDVPECHSVTGPRPGNRSPTHSPDPEQHGQGIYTR